MKKKILLILTIILIGNFGITVSADTVKANDMVSIGSSEFGNMYASGISGNSSTNLQIYISHNIRNYPDITEYTTLVLDVCTGAINNYFGVERTARVGQSCTNSCYSNNIVVNNLGNNAIGSNGYSCQFQRVFIPINKFQISSSCGANACIVTVDDRISFKNSLSYYVGMDITDIYISDEISYNNDGSMTQQSINNLNTSINNLNSSINNQTNTITNNANANTDKIINKDHDYNNNPSQNIQGNQEVDDLSDKESQLFDNIDLSGTDINVSINPNANNFIWEIVNRLREMNTNIILLITSALGLGIIKMILNR